MKVCLPIDDMESIDNDFIIDMSELKFPVSSDAQVRASLLYLRNTGISPSGYDFSLCSYESKSEFLMLIIKNMRYNVNIGPLITTWIKIISTGVIDVHLDSILSDEEINKFRIENRLFIDELCKFLISVPLCAMNLYNSSGNNNINLDEFKHNDFNDFNPYTIMKLLEYDECVTVSRLIDGIIPEYYDLYFNTNNECIPGFINSIINKFPYLSLLNIIMNDSTDVVEKFINGISEFLNN